MVAEFDPALPCDRKGVVSIQPDSGDWLEADSGMGEDCLNLNVWAPEQPAGKALPVTVYIHGDGFEYGANTQITSNAAGLAATGRVVGVSINYRLGALGPLSLSQYGGKLAEASNLFLQDVIAALTWIQRNIAHFGGDPANVTVYGHSGGAYTSFGLLGASSADGLYRRLAGFSGGPARSIPAWWAEELAHRFVTELGVADNPEKLLDLDPLSLRDALRKVLPTDLGVRGGVDNKATGVVLDIGQPGAVVHAHPMDVLASGAHGDVDVLLSMASDDMGWWVANGLGRFDPQTIDRVTDEVAGWRISRSRAKKIDDARRALIAMADSDGRYLLNMAEQLQDLPATGTPLDTAALAHHIQQRAPLYDKAQEGHYNLISALHKSMRGSDPDASTHGPANLTRSQAGSSTDPGTTRAPIPLPLRRGQGRGTRRPTPAGGCSGSTAHRLHGPGDTRPSSRKVLIRVGGAVRGS